jgi:hypothetical protein
MFFRRLASEVDGLPPVSTCAAFAQSSNSASGALYRYQSPALALLLSDRNPPVSGAEAVGTYASGVRFRLAIVETGEQWVVTCTASHGKAVSRKPTPLSPYVRHRAAAGESEMDVEAYTCECGCARWTA